MTGNYIHIKDGAIDACLDVLIKKDQNGVFVSYAPALDISGCGHSLEEAKRSFEIVLTEYLKYTLENGTLEQDLLEHKWKKRRIHLSHLLSGPSLEPTRQRRRCMPVSFPRVRNG